MQVVSKELSFKWDKILGKFGVRADCMTLLCDGKNECTFKPKISRRTKTIAGAELDFNLALDAAIKGYETANTKSTIETTCDGDRRRASSQCINAIQSH